MSRLEFIVVGSYFCDLTASPVNISILNWRKKEEIYFAVNDEYLICLMKDTNQGFARCVVEINVDYGNEIVILAPIVGQVDTIKREV